MRHKRTNIPQQLGEEEEGKTGLKSDDPGRSK